MVLTLDKEEQEEVSVYQLRICKTEITCYFRRVKSGSSGGRASLPPVPVTNLLLKGRRFFNPAGSQID